MRARGLVGAVLAAALALAGCSGAEVTPAPTATYTKAQADACASDAIGWWSDAPAAYDVWTASALCPR
jgi:hypothetical protein